MCCSTCLLHLRLQVHLVVQSVQLALLRAAQELAPLPAGLVTPQASGNAVFAAAEQHAQRQLGLTGRAAQLAAHQLGNQGILDSQLPPAQQRRLLATVSRLANKGWDANNTQQLHAVAAAMLTQLKPQAEQHVAAGSPAAQELALERCHVLSNRRCAHLACTNVPLLLGIDGRPYKCTGCRTVWYCSAACSRADWRVHKQACRQLAGAQAGVPAAGGGEGSRGSGRRGSVSGRAASALHKLLIYGTSRAAWHDVSCRLFTCLVDRAGQWGSYT